MDEAGVDLQLICQGAGVYADQLPPDQALDIVRMSNNVLAERLEGYKDRLLGVTALSLKNIAASVAEIERTAKQGFRAVLLYPHVDGKMLVDTPEMDPIFAKISELDLPIFLHGAGTAQDPSLARLEDGGAGVAYAVLSDGEVAECCLRMIASGLFDRYPNLKIVIRSSGGGIPLLLHRFFWKHKGPRRRAALLGDFSRAFSHRLRQLRCPDPVVSDRQDGREQHGFRLRLLRRAGAAQQIFYSHLRAAQSRAYQRLHGKKFAPAAPHLTWKLEPPRLVGSA